MNLYRQKSTEETIDKLAELENEIPDCKNIVLYWHLQLLNYFGRPKEVISLVEQNIDYLKEFPENSEIYANSFYYYIVALNNTWNPEKAILVYDSLPEALQMNVYYYDQFAYSSYLLINLSTTQDEMDFYKKQAISSYKLLQNSNYNIGERMQGWLESVER